MRALFEDQFYGSKDPTSGLVGSGKFVLHKPVWGSAPYVDLFFRVEKQGAGQPIEVYAYASLALARAHDVDTPVGYLASVSIDPDDLGDSFATMTLHAMSPLAGAVPQISVSFYAYGSQGGPGTLSGIMAYTVAPDLYACDAIVDVLSEYTATGYVLEDFAGPPTKIAVGDPGVARPMPYVWVRTTGFEFLESMSTGSIFAIQYALEITILAHRMDSGDQAGPQEQAWRKCRLYQSRIESILFDERRTLDDSLFVLAALEGSAPAPTDDSLMYEATVAVGAEFLVIWPERT